jgi:hypothetical protein
MSGLFNLGRSLAITFRHSPCAREAASNGRRGVKLAPLEVDPPEVLPTPLKSLATAGSPRTISANFCVRHHLRCEVP